MILQALCHYYDILSQEGKIAPPGWGSVKVSFALVLDLDGQILDLLPTTREETRGKKTVTLPKEMILPLPVKRSVNVAANFLCDNATYFLGMDRGNPERSRRCREASAALHKKLLAPLECDAAKAVCRFFDSWGPEEVSQHPVLEPYLDELAAGGNLVFRVEGQYLHEIPEIRSAWQNRDEGSTEEAVSARCLVTGKRAPIARIHAAIKGVQGAQSSGAALVSFNAPSFTSYGKEQNYNAPISEEAAFAYTTALNTLLADREHTVRLGDTTVVYWAENAQSAYQDLFGGLLDPSGAHGTFSENDLAGAMKALAEGRPFQFEGIPISQDVTFFILGLAPNAARLAVRFFYQDTFGKLSQNLMEHYRRLEIVRPKNDPYQYLPLWVLLRETANQNSTDKAPPPLLAGAVTRAILENSYYPASLFSAVLLRVRADHTINRNRAAILKAWLAKNRPDNNHFKEVSTVKLNEDTNYLPYLLGRLFSLLEAIQEAANPNLNATIKDRYFSSASATPGAVFPILLRLSQNHMKVVSRDKPGLAVTLDKRLQNLMERIDETFPAHMNLEEQGAFILGYYHETQRRYQKAEGGNQNG